MSKTVRICAVGVAALAFPIAASAQTVNVGTDASVTATFVAAYQSAGPFPWNDLGVTASATVAPGDLNVTTGGSTAFTLDTSVTAGQRFTAGSTVLNVSYTPGWTGSVYAAPATGNLSSNFVYNIGPLSGSTNLLNVPLSVTGSPNADLGSTLNAPAGPAVSSSASGSGPGVSAGYTLQAQACAIVGCVTLASASVNVNVGSQVQQTVVATPTVTYGDLVWESTTPKYSSSDTVTFVPGSGGHITNVFGAPPASLNLSTGQVFYYNILPVVELTMPVTSQAELDLPASITASYDVFGVGGSKTWPLGNLYSLSTGTEGFEFDNTFNGNDYYSVPLEFGSDCNFNIVCPPPGFIVPTSYVGSLVPLNTGGIPPDSGPCGATLVGCDLSIPAGSGSTGGYGVPNLGSLLPGDPSSGEVCGLAGTAYAGDCINTVTLTAVPEPDNVLLFGIGLAGLGFVTNRPRRPRFSSSGIAHSTPTSIDASVGST